MEMQSSLNPEIHTLGKYKYNDIAVLKDVLTVNAVTIEAKLHNKCQGVFFEFENANGHLITEEVRKSRLYSSKTFIIIISITSFPFSTSTDDRSQYSLNYCSDMAATSKNTRAFIHLEGNVLCVPLTFLFGQ